MCASVEVCVCVHVCMHAQFSELLRPGMKGNSTLRPMESEFQVPFEQN